MINSSLTTACNYITSQMDANETRVMTIVMISVGYNDYISMGCYSSSLAVGSIMVVKKGNLVVFYIAQYPARWTAQSTEHFLPSTDLFISTPTRLLREAF